MLRQKLFGYSNHSNISRKYIWLAIEQFAQDFVLNKWVRWFDYFKSLICQVPLWMVTQKLMGEYAFVSQLGLLLVKVVNPNVGFNMFYEKKKKKRKKKTQLVLNSMNHNSVTTFKLVHRCLSRITSPQFYSSDSSKEHW